MDDLINKVGALIEEHVKSEVEARGPSLTVAYNVIEEARRVLGAGKGEGLKAAAVRVVSEREHLRDQPPKDERANLLHHMLRVQTQHSDLVSSTLETVRDVLGAPPGAESATDAARRVVRERDGLKAERDKYRTMWEQLHRAQGEDLEATRLRDIRLVAERDDACAAKDQAIRDLQAMREKVQALELKLLEVRRAVG